MDRELRHPTLLVGLTMDRDELRSGSTRGSRRWSPPGAAEEVRRADAAGASRTARAALGFEELLAGDVEAMKRPTRATPAASSPGCGKMEGVRLIDRTGRDDDEVAAEIVAALERVACRRDAVREVAGAGQRLRDRRGATRCPGS